MSGTVIASIVEGHGDVDALPILLRRINSSLVVARPIRVKRQRIVDPDELRRYALIAEANIVQRGGRGSVLLLLDADQDCAATLGPVLRRHISEALPHRTCACSLAVRDYESWLVAGDALAPTNPDESRGGKAWLAQRHGHYSETADQPRLTARLDIPRVEAASRSFRHLVAAVRLLCELPPHSATGA